MKLSHIIIAISVLGTLATCCSAQEVEFKLLHTFGATGDGSVPYGPLVIDSKGHLYGVTVAGGTGCTGGCGTVFQLSPAANTWNENILYNFTTGNGGAYPWGGLLIAGPAKFYGTVEGYGSYAVGGIFELSSSISGWNYSLVYEGGAGPGVVFDSLGNLYGAIGSGDYFGLGAIGELSPSSSGWIYSQLYGFTCQNGCWGGYGPFGSAHLGRQGQPLGHNEGRRHWPASLPQRRRLRSRF